MSAMTPGWWFESGTWDRPGRWRLRRREQVAAQVTSRAPYNLWMTTLQTISARPARSPRLPADLTLAEAVRIDEAITAAHAESTRTV
jgi:hypothetical protein